MHLFKKSKLFVLLFTLSLFLTACGGGGGSSAATDNGTNQTQKENTDNNDSSSENSDNNDSSSNNTDNNDSSSGNNEAKTIKIGKFLDSEVEGLKYITSSNIEGTTNSQGEYQYYEGDDINFSIENIILGQTTAQSEITPLTLFKTTEITNEKVLNLLVLLQSLDDDGNPDNGIKLASEKIKKLEKIKIDFSKNEILDISDIMSKNGFELKNITSRNDALVHFRKTIDDNNILVDEVKSERSYVTDYGSNGIDDRLITAKYNALGQIVSWEKSIVGLEPRIYNKYIYNDRNKLLKFVTIDNVGVESIKEEYTYNDDGLMTIKEVISYSSSYTLFKYYEDKILNKEVYIFKNSNKDIVNKTTLFYKEDKVLYKMEKNDIGSVIVTSLYNDTNVKIKKLYLYSNYANVNLSHGLLNNETIEFSDQNANSFVNAVEYDSSYNITKILTNYSNGDKSVTDKTYTLDNDILSINKTNTINGTEELEYKYLYEYDNFKKLIKREYTNYLYASYSYVDTWARTYNSSDICTQTILTRGANIRQKWEYFDNGEAKSHEFFGFNHNSNSYVNSNVSGDVYSGGSFKYILKTYILKNNKALIKNVKASKVDNTSELINIDYNWYDDSTIHSLYYTGADGQKEYTIFTYDKDGEIATREDRSQTYKRNVSKSPLIKNSDVNTNMVSLLITHDNIKNKDTQAIKYFYDDKSRLVNMIEYDLESTSYDNITTIKWNNDNLVVEKTTKTIKIETEYDNNKLVKKEIHTDLSDGDVDTYTHVHTYSNNIRTSSIQVDLNTNGSIDKTLTNKYDADGKLINEDSSEQYSAHYKYEYNSDNLILKKIWSYPGTSDKIMENYTYNSNKLDKVIYYNWTNYDSVKYEYSNNLISKTKNDKNNDGTIESEVYYYYVK